MPQPTVSSFSSAPQQRAVLNTVRWRPAPTGPVPVALPCHNYYDVYPHAAGPFGNIVVTDAAEIEQWQLVARRVSQEEAQQHGGCIIYTTFSSTPSADEASTAISTDSVAETQYLCITDTDDVVYGRASYLPNPPRRAHAKRCGVTEFDKSSSNENSSNGGCTDEEAASINSQ